MTEGRNGVPISVGATKEFFVPATYGDGTHQAFVDYPVWYCGAVDKFAAVAFYVPADFNSITEAVFVGVPANTQAAANYDIYSDYAAAGELYNAHSESDLASTYNVTINIMTEIDISGILSALAAGDYVGVRLMVKAVDHYFLALGVRFKYS